jgi:hypothetical protein
VTPKEIVLKIVHSNFETLVDEWVSSNHDPDRDTLVIRSEGADESCVFKAEFHSNIEFKSILEGLKKDILIIEQLILGGDPIRVLPLVILISSALTDQEISPIKNESQVHASDPMQTDLALRSST